MRTEMLRPSVSTHHHRVLRKQSKSWIRTCTSRRGLAGFKTNYAWGIGKSTCRAIYNCDSTKTHRQQIQEELSVSMLDDTAEINNLSPCPSMLAFSVAF